MELIFTHVDKSFSLWYHSFAEKNASDMGKSCFFMQPMCNMRQKNSDLQGMVISMKVDTFANRLRTAMKQSNMNAALLSRKSGVSTSTLSQYLSGKYIAKRERVSLFASIFGCSPLWLEGYDVSQNDAQIQACILPVLNGAVRDEKELAECARQRGEIASSQLADGRHYYLSIENNALQPALRRGDLLMIELCSGLQKGQLGVFLIDGKSFVIRELLDDAVGYYLGFTAASGCTPMLYLHDKSPHAAVVGRVLYAVSKW